ncbi:MAG TPA: helix-turn-helix domain-containing protein [Gemmatimonadaceae bacterium]|nr:helix-turn-helix domain-containing protein [Gemmatimonadaceae bacterium]
MDVRDKLLNAAARVYAEVGYRGATTRRIAQEAGVNEITLFRHFGSKDALLVEALRACGAVGELPELPAEPADPEQELITWCRAHHARLYERRSLIRTCLGEMAERPEMGRSATTGPYIAATMLREYFVRLRERGIATGDFDPDCAAWLLLAAIFSDAMWRDVMAAEEHWKDADASFAECVRMVLVAVGAPVSARGVTGAA